jgi:hypothetical protein
MTKHTIAGVAMAAGLALAATARKEAGATGLTGQEERRPSARSGRGEPAEPRINVEVHDYAVFEQRQRVFESIGAFTWVSINLAWDQGQPERFSKAA